LGSWKPDFGDRLQRLQQSADALEKLSMGLENQSSPSLVGQDLAAARHSLRVLVLEKSKMCRWRAVYYESCLDLRGFEELERAHVVPPPFLGAEYADWWRRGLYRLLPKSLLELQVITFRVAHI
jgi:hypothetical protein